MFTGIIERLGTVEKIIASYANKTFWIKSSLAPQLHVDESVSHNGVCLTIEEIAGEDYRVTAVHETLLKSNMQNLKKDDILNLERAMQMNGRLDGHIVQGHVDGTGACLSKKDQGGSMEFIFSFDKRDAALIIEKGSICVNGVSLTAFNITINTFTVAVIPYTLEHTNLKSIETGDIINLEFDILGKYVNRMYALKAQ